MIIRRGENIYCVEIQERLIQHDAIADAAIIGVPHAELGEKFKAVVPVVAGRSIPETEIKQRVADDLDVEVSAYLELETDELPRNASGKLLKDVLRGKGVIAFEETM